MAGTALAAGLIAVTATLTIGLGMAGGAAVASQRLAAAADAAALAAADTASGAVAVEGAPCEVAARVAEASGARLSGCTLAGLVATVSVVSTYAGIGATAHARAGPPEG